MSEIKMNKQLKPCPFCGSNKLTFENHYGLNGTVSVECRNCGMRFEYEENYQEVISRDKYYPNIEYHTGYYLKIRPTFIEVWNRRTNRDNES